MPCRINESGYGLRQLQRIGVLLKDAVDFRRAALPIDGKRVDGIDS
jgi:hypothetical protein